MKVTDRRILFQTSSEIEIPLRERGEKKMTTTDKVIEMTTEGGEGNFARRGGL